MFSTAIPSEAISFARNVAAFKGITAACATFYFYYNITHFSEEVRSLIDASGIAFPNSHLPYIDGVYLGKEMDVWKSFVSSAMCFASIFVVCSVTGVSNYAWHDHRYAFRRNTSNAHNFLKTCLHGGLYSDLGPMIILIAESKSYVLSVAFNTSNAHNFLKTCLHGGLYSGLGPMIILIAESKSRNRKALVSFVSSTLVLFGVDILQSTNLFLGVEEGLYKDGRCKPNIFAYSDGPFACMTAQPMSGIGLRLFRRSRKRDSSNGDILTTAMARESIVYFVVIFTVCFIAVVLVFIFEHVHIDDESVLFQMNAYETIVITVMAILAPKLIIDLRAECYHQSATSTIQLSWNADVQRRFASDREGSSSSDM
ncbi:hypothetical protein A7U60_g1145 [Sanghuangporus baumii]|uniref:Uncharacterized protein n=1 Tax=Sanghuangporus baumii TaxID=108892 RepID=A0A9Q5N9K2_SANBA|nr:hypothetical protein A7U60_g1145 [Sanghuangporus baumii]